MANLQTVEQNQPVDPLMYNFPVDDEIRKLAQTPSLTSWWDPRAIGNYPYVQAQGIEGKTFRMRDKSRQNAAKAKFTNAPNRVAFGPRGAPGLQYGAGGLPTTSVLNGAVIVPAVVLITPAGFTLLAGLQLDASSGGAALAEARDNSGFALTANSGKMTVYPAANGASALADPVDRRGAGAFFVGVEYEHAATRLALYTNGQLVAERNDVPITIASGVLSMGGAGLTTGQLAAYGMIIGEVATFAAPLGARSREAQLGRWNLHFAGLYL